MPRLQMGQDLRYQAWHQRNGRCHICGGFVSFEDSSIDHVVAVDLEGSNDIANLLPAHGRCNHLKWHNSPETMRRILFLGMVANHDGYSGHRGEDVRQRRARRLAQNWLKREREKAKLQPQRDSVDLLNRSADLLGEFIKFESLVADTLEELKAKRREEKRQGVKGGRPEWDNALALTMRDPRTPSRLRNAYQTLAWFEEHPVDDE